MRNLKTICQLDLEASPANTCRVKAWALVSSIMLAAVSICVVVMRPRQVTASPQVPGPSLSLTLSEIKIYGRAQTLIAWTPRQIHDCPFLRGLQPAEHQDQLPMVLDRAGQTGNQLFHDFPRIACDENVFTEATGIVVRTKSHKFRYIVIPQSDGHALAFDEYRTDLKGNPLESSRLGDFIMFTSDFASTSLYLSPADQNDSRFRYFGMQTIRNRDCHVVGFAQDPVKVHSVSVILIEGKSVTLLVQGLAWIDAKSLQILRIVTWLLAPRGDIGLSSEVSTVDFYPVKPSGSERVLWLPRDVTVKIRYGNWAVRNTHHYSNFKLFRVESKIKSGE